MPNPFFSLQGLQGQTRPDALKITKSALKFGPLSITRVNTVPPMEHGRPGDLVIIDDTDNPSTQLQTSQTPESVGLWIKQPLSYSDTPTGNLVIGFPNAFAQAGDVIEINGVSVVLNPPYNHAQVVMDIIAAAIPGVNALALGEAVVIQETGGGAITVTDVFGQPSQSLGLYNQPSLSLIVPNGAWVPLQIAAASGGPGAPAAAAYLTLASDATLTDERVLAGGKATSITDGGPGTTATIDHDITGVGAAGEAVDPTDELLIHNVSTNNVEKITVADFPSVSSTEAVQHRNVTVGTSSANIGPLLPAGSIVKRVLVRVDTAYPAGTTIEVGDAGDPSRLMTAADNDPQNINTYETVTIYQYTVSTQITVAVSGSPGFGSSQVIVDFIQP